LSFHLFCPALLLLISRHFCCSTRCLFSCKYFTLIAPFSVASVTLAAHFRRPLFVLCIMRPAVIKAGKKKRSATKKKESVEKRALGNFCLNLRGECPLFLAFSGPLTICTPQCVRISGHLSFYIEPPHTIPSQVPLEPDTVSNLLFFSRANA